MLVKLCTHPEHHHTSSLCPSLQDSHVSALHSSKTHPDPSGHLDAVLWQLLELLCTLCWGTWFSESCRWQADVGLDDLIGLVQPWWFCASMILWPGTEDVWCPFKHWSGSPALCRQHNGGTRAHCNRRSSAGSVEQPAWKCGVKCPVSVYQLSAKFPGRQKGNLGSAFGKTDAGRRKEDVWLRNSAWSKISFVKNSVFASPVHIDCVQLWTAAEAYLYLLPEQKSWFWAALILASRYRKLAWL